MNDNQNIDKSAIQDNVEYGLWQYSPARNGDKN